MVYCYFYFSETPEACVRRRDPKIGNKYVQRDSFFHPIERETLKKDRKRKVLYSNFILMVPKTCVRRRDPKICNKICLKRLVLFPNVKEIKLRRSKKEGSLK